MRRRARAAGTRSRRGRALGSRGGATPGAVDQGEPGFLTGVDEAELRERRRALIDDPARARTMGARARTIALERYSAERMTDDYLALYERAVREQRR